MSFLSNFPGSSPRSSSSSMKELKKEEKKKHVYRGEIIDDENEAESVWKSILKRKGLPSDTKYQYIDTLDKAFDESYCDMLYQTIEEKKKNPEGRTTFEWLPPPAPASATFLKSPFTYSVAFDERKYERIISRNVHVIIYPLGSEAANRRCQLSQETTRKHEELLAKRPPFVCRVQYHKDVVSPDPMADSQAKEAYFLKAGPFGARDPMADSQTKELSFFQAGPFGIRVGDSVIATYGAEGVEADVFARITSIKSNTLGVNFRIQRYYTPEETVGGKQPFYGNKELLLTNHLDNLDPKQIVKKINVHSFVDYMKLETVGPNDYFFRFEYEIGSGWLSPAIIEVFCKCLMPFNPDMFTLKCEACKERYHPDCIKMTLDEAKQLADNFTCSDCLAPDNQGCASAASATVDP